MTLRQRAAVSTPARVALAGAGVVAVLATSLGQAPLAAGHAGGRDPPPRQPPRPPSPRPPRVGCRAPSSPSPPTCRPRPATPRTSRAASRSATCSRRRTRARRTGSRRSCGSDALSTTEHYDGRAVDWFTNVRTAEGKARGNALVSWLTATDAKGNVAANARRLGVMYIIWNNRIWGAYNPAAGWRPYSSCATHHRGQQRHRRATATTSTSPCPGRARWAARRGGPSPLRAQDFGPCRVPDLNWAPAYTRLQPRPVPVLPEGLRRERRLGAEPVAGRLLRDDAAHRLHRPRGQGGPDGGRHRRGRRLRRRHRHGGPRRSSGRTALPGRRPGRASGPGVRCSRPPRPPRRPQDQRRTGTTPTRTRCCRSARRDTAVMVLQKALRPQRWWTGTSAPAPGPPSSPSRGRTT